MMYQGWFICCNKCAALVQHVGDGGRLYLWGEGSIWEVSVLSTQMEKGPVGGGNDTLSDSLQN